MFDKRERGKYSIVSKKTIKNIEYEKIETTMVNSVNKVVNYTVEYSKPIPFGKENNDWEIIREFKS